MRRLRRRRAQSPRSKVWRAATAAAQVSPGCVSTPAAPRAWCRAAMPLGPCWSVVVAFPCALRAPGAPCSRGGHADEIHVGGHEMPSSCGRHGSFGSTDRADARCRSLAGCRPRARSSSIKTAGRAVRAACKTPTEARGCRSGVSARSMRRTRAYRDPLTANPQSIGIDRREPCTQ